MEPKKICQSCTMPIDNAEDRGTEKDGSKSELYCKYCYQQGAFVDPTTTFDQMKEIVVTQMRKRDIPENIVQQSLDHLAGLKRWKRAGL
jgi:hypothetical protein